MDKFTKKLLDSFSKEITDQVFLYIQGDREFMHEYLNLINKMDIHYVNSTIAKAIKERYGLANTNHKGKPKSTLIQGFEEFK